MGKYRMSTSPAWFGVRKRPSTWEKTPAGLYTDCFGLVSAIYIFMRAAPKGRFHRFQWLCGQVGHSLQKSLNLVEIYRLLTLSLLYISSTFSHLVKLI